MGRITAVNISEKKGTQKHHVHEARLIKEYGIEGDAHAGRWHRQVSLLSKDRIEAFRAAGAEVDDGAFGENLIVSGIDFSSLPVGTRFRSGDIVLEMTQIGKQCHHGCAIYQKMGDCIMPREGVFARVVKGGMIHEGDELTVSEYPDEKKLRFVMAQITHTQGSTPRKKGAYMLVFSDGSTEGTVGGGASEYATIQEALKLLDSDQKETVVRHYDLGPTDASRLGMVCGGSIDVTFVYVDLNDRASCEAYQTRVYEQKREQIDGTVYVFGGGHVAQQLVPLLHHLSFRTVVLDDREQFANASVFPEADEIYVCDFQAVEQSVPITEQDYVVVMTRGHQFDYEVQSQALLAHPYYIGIMGSRSKIEYVTQKLLTDGFSHSDISACHMPIGTDILAQTPEEIAVSVAGELIMQRAKRKKDGQSIGKNENCK